MKGLIDKFKQLFTFSNQKTGDVPLVCPGYLPFKIQIEQKLKEISRTAGLSGEDAEKILQQIRTYKNN